MSLDVYCPDCDIWMSQEELSEGNCPFCDTPIEDEELHDEEDEE